MGVKWETSLWAVHNSSKIDFASRSNGNLSDNFLETSISNSLTLPASGLNAIVSNIIPSKIKMF